MHPTIISKVMSEMGKKGGARVVDKYGKEKMLEWSRKGIAARKEQAKLARLSKENTG